MGMSILGHFLIWMSQKLDHSDPNLFRIAKQAYFISRVFHVVKLLTGAIFFNSETEKFFKQSFLSYPWLPNSTKCQVAGA